MSCEAFWKARASAVLRSLHEQAERGESLMMAATLDPQVSEKNTQPKYANNQLLPAINTPSDPFLKGWVY